MSDLTGEERANYVREMFALIAPRYDLMNCLMTVGQDTHWRRQVIRRAELPPNGKLLDLGAGTGDLAFEALMQCPGCYVVAADFTMPMMRYGQSRLIEPRYSNQNLEWLGADARWLPLETGTLDAVVSGFLMRNLPDAQGSLREQYRVLKEGGRVVVLDTTPPQWSALAPFIRIFLHRVIPALGSLVAGNRDAYTYLPESTEGFLHPEQTTDRLTSAGFRLVTFQRLMFGTVAIHWGWK